MQIALAQVSSVRGDIAANLVKHRHWIEAAGERGADLVVFPELSLTGYWPSLAESLATDQDDPRLDALQAASDRAGCIVAAGLPTRTDSGRRISMVVFTPEMPRRTYSKQLLHSDELPFFEHGADSLVLDLAGLRIAPAICFESFQPEHAAAASASGAQLYMTSVAKPQHSLEDARTYLAELAKDRAMAVSIVNAVGPSEEFPTAGCSAAWDASGACLGQLGSEEEELLLFGLDQD